MHTRYGGYIYPKSKEIERERELRKPASLPRNNTPKIKENASLKQISD